MLSVGGSVHEALADLPSTNLNLVILDDPRRIGDRRQLCQAPLYLIEFDVGLNDHVGMDVHHVVVAEIAHLTSASGGADLSVTPRQFAVDSGDLEFLGW